MTWPPWPALTRSLAFLGTEAAQFVTAAPLRKGASVAVKYPEVLIGENDVTRIEVRSAKK